MKSGMEFYTIIFMRKTGARVKRLAEKRRNGAAAQRPVEALLNALATACMIPLLL